MSRTESSSDGRASQSGSTRHTNDFPHLIRQARDGADGALDELIRSCQTYLLLVANEELGNGMRGKLGPSDVVQSALAQVQQHIGQFRGASKGELLSWLRTILRNEIHTAHRRYTAEKRDVNREVAMTESGAAPAATCADRQPSPRSEAMLDEEAAALRGALRRLPPDYRQVVLLRNWEQLAFDEVGRRMNRSTEAVKKLWSRAMRKLREELDETT